MEIKEFPAQMYKSGDDLRREGITETVNTEVNGEPYTYTRYTAEVDEMERHLRRNRLFELNSWTDEDLIQAYEAALEKAPQYYGIKTEYFKAVLDDVDAFVQSYNYDDSDGMIDYFDTNFYYFGCDCTECKVVSKTERIRERGTKPAAAAEADFAEKAEQPEPEQPLEIGSKPAYTYKVTRGEDTRDGSPLWVVRIAEKLERAAYIAENKAMKERGGYYSKFLHGFIFRFDPAEVLGLTG